jgi:hypothetical protein
MDIQAWCGLTRLGEVVERLGDRLVRFAGEGSSRPLYDLPDGPRPDPDVPAPVRFLPDFDNVLLGHADRSRIVADEVRRAFLGITGVLPGSVLVDGRVACSWAVTTQGGSATLEVTPVAGPLPRAARAEVEDEGARLLDLLAAGAGAGDRRVRIRPAG